MRPAIAIDFDSAIVTEPRFDDDGPTDIETAVTAVERPRPARPSRPPESRFQLGEVLGAGGMGEVRVARDRNVGREVAVKRMRGELHPAAVARFLREARVQGRLDHPAVVPLYDLDRDEHGVPYFAMKRLTGITLQEVLARHAEGDPEAFTRWPRRLLLARLVDVCFAIEFAHTRGVIHRDLKPANIMLGDFGEAYVLDWGIARLVDADIPDHEISRHGLASIAPDEGQTAAGAQLGTPGYMPPEQVRGEIVDQRADVYALGCILFEILTGQPALPRGPQVFAVTLATPAHRPAERFPELDVAPELDELCARATARDPAARLVSPRALATGIERYLDGDRDVARRRELARDCGVAAHRALGRGDRSEAMREAGRALALDPTNPASQELVGHLLLSPAVTPVAEVERELERERVRTGRVQLGSAVIVYALFLAAMPALSAFGVRSRGWVIALAIGIAANLVAFLTASRHRGSIASWIPLGLALHCGTLSLAGIVLGPLLVLPSLAVGSVAVFLGQPMVVRRWPVVAAHLAAVLGPLALELAGVVPRTFVLRDTGIELRSWAIDLSAGGLLVVLAVATVMQVIATSVLVLQLRSAKDSAERATQAQLWHLRQLLPARQPTGGRVTR